MTRIAKELEVIIRVSRWAEKWTKSPPTGWNYCCIVAAHKKS
jgi:hypothetical protein